MDSEPNKQMPDTHKVKPAPEADAVLDVLRSYGPAAAIALILALAIFLGITFHRQRQASAHIEASQQFMRAQTAEQLQMIVDEYPQTVTAPIALLALASERFHEGAIDLAEMHYNQFLERHSNHAMRPAAELGLAYCDEARGQLDDALEGFRSFIDVHGDHYLAGPARLAEARVLAQRGRHDEARAIYEDIVDDPEHPWRAQARSDLMYMEKDIRARAQ